MVNIREIVLNILMEYDKDGGKKTTLLKDALEKYDYLETRDKAFIKRVVEGCLERNIQIDYVIDSFSKTETKKMQPLIRNLIRMGTYQIMFMDSIPDSAACNEAVKLAQKHSFAGLKGFVNGVLRNISRNKENIQYPDKSINNGTYRLSVLYSVPEWLCKMWTEVYGLEKTEEILKFFLEVRPTVVRVAKDPENSVDTLKKQLEGAGVVVKKNDLLPYALELEKTDNIRFLPGFDDGCFAVMDVSSMLVTEIAGPSKGQTVVDVCAAPGGKTMHAALMVGQSGKVISRDVSERKCELITENARRLGLENVLTQVHDAKIHDEDMKGQADVLYLDVPCSGLGIIGRKSDIKQNIKQKSLKELTALQWEIVKASWDYVKPGGILMYSTCTVDRAENEDMITKICKEFPFAPEDITGRLPEKIRKSLDPAKENAAKNGYIQILPGEYGTDGFFIAKLRRVY